MRGCRSPILSPLTGVRRRLVVPRHPPTAHSVLPGLWTLGSTCMPHVCSVHATYVDVTSVNLSYAHDAMNLERCKVQQTLAC